MRTTTLATYTRFAALLTAVAPPVWELPMRAIGTRPGTTGPNGRAATSPRNLHAAAACTILSMAIRRPRSHSEFGTYLQSGRKMGCSR